jgi:hypothetical protein
MARADEIFGWPHKLAMSIDIWLAYFVGIATQPRLPSTVSEAMLTGK